MPNFKFNFNHGTRYINGPLINLGATRGKGSSTRMLNHCKSNSANPSDCLNKVLKLEKPFVLKSPFGEWNKPFELFDISSFDKMDNVIKRMNTNEPYWNPNNIDYKSALIYAANRWSKLISLYFPIVYLFRKLMKNGDWKGIYLGSTFFASEELTVSTIATCDPLPHIYEQSSFVKGFNLLINITKMNDYYQQSVGNILTHELGHALGITLWNVWTNGTTNSGVLNLPMLDITQRYNFWHNLSHKLTNDTPPKLRLGHYNAVSAYNLYGGTNIGEPKKTHGTPIIGEFESNNNSCEKLAISQSNDKLPLHVNDMYHFRQTPIYIDNGLFTPDTIFRGIKNDIMVPYYSPQVQYFISNISIGYLLDMGTWYDGVWYGNYARKLGGGSEYDGSEVTSKPENIDDVLHFSGVAPEHTKNSNDKSIDNIYKNIEPETELVCKCCQPKI
jgi:hypothetical protein